MNEFKLNCETSGVRLDKFISDANIDLSRSAAVNLIENGAVLVNDSVVSKKYKLSQGDIVVVNVPDPTPYEAKAENIPLDIVYEDEYLLVVNKPKGMVVHPAAGNYDGTLVNALLYHCGDSLSGINGILRPGIVHRIDKDTSGLVLAAKHAYAAPLLAQRVQKLYYAVPQGELPLGPGVIDAPIGRRGDSIIGRCVTPEGKPSRTEYEILRAENGLSLAACLPVTGRTHQIRVHFAHLGHPLAGDDLYGGSRERIGRQALHCARQTFWLPQGRQEGERLWIDAPQQLHSITVECPLPPDIQALFW